MLTSLAARAASWLNPGCAVEQGEFGTRLVPTSEWGPRHIEFMRKLDLTEVHLNSERGLIHPAGTDIIASLPPSLEGLKIVDHRIHRLPLGPAAKLTLRSLDLSFLGKLSEALAFDRFEALERLKVLIPIPGTESVFRCARLQHLALSRYAGSLSEGTFSLLPCLRSLSLGAVRLTDLTPLASLAALETLAVAGAKGLRSLRGAEAMTRLRDLSIESTAGIDSLQPISGLTSLERLWLYNAGDIATLRPLLGLFNLRELTLIGSTTVSDGQLGLLESLPKLKTVCIVDRPHYHPKADLINRPSK